MLRAWRTGSNALKQAAIPIPSITPKAQVVLEWACRKDATDLCNPEKVQPVPSSRNKPPHLKLMAIRLTFVPD